MATNLDALREEVARKKAEQERAEEGLTDEQTCVWVSNVPLGGHKDDLMGFFNGALLTAGTNIPGSLDGVSESCLPVVSCCAKKDRKGAVGCMLELRNPTLAQLCLRLSGIPFGQNILSVGKISENLDPNTPLEPKPEPTPVETKTNFQTGDHKVYVQDLPIDMPDDQVKEMLEQFGQLRVLNVIRDPVTDVSKGYGFFEYEDSEITDFAIQALHGFVCGRNILKVQRSTCPAPSAIQAPGNSNLRALVTGLPTSMTRRILDNPTVEIQVRWGKKAGEKPSNIVQLLNAILPEDLVDDDEYEALIVDLLSEAERYGPVKEIVVPRPTADLQHQEGVGKIFLHFSDLTAARKAQLMLNGRRFDNKRVVCAAFFPYERFVSKKYAT